MKFLCKSFGLIILVFILGFGCGAVFRYLTPKYALEVDSSTNTPVRCIEKATNSAVDLSFCEGKYDLIYIGPLSEVPN